MRLYDYAKPGDRILSHAKQEAARTLGSVGIAVRWLDLPADDGGAAQRTGSCDAAAGPTDLVIRLLAARMREEVSSETGTFGYALVGDNPHAADRFGAVRQCGAGWPGSEIKTPRTARFTARFRTSAMSASCWGTWWLTRSAHLLLGSNRHSRGGLMQAHWNANATRDAVLGRLLFDAGETKKIRRQMMRRLQVQ